MLLLWIFPSTQFKLSEAGAPNDRTGLQSAMALDAHMLFLLRRRLRDWKSNEWVLCVALVGHKVSSVQQRITVRALTPKTSVMLTCAGTTGQQLHTV